VEKIKFNCEFCKKDFVKEISLINHFCKKKQRWFAKDEPPSRIAFEAWNRFYQLNGHIKRKVNTFEDFMNSKYYIAFIKFGKHIADLDAIDPAKFIDYVIKNNLPLDKWSHDFVYEQYIRDLTKKETPDIAFERSLILMNGWSMETGEPWFDFFRKVNTNQAIHWIKSGRLSPWVLYNTNKSADLFERCNAEQLNIIATYAPIGPWKIKFNNNKTDCLFIRESLKNSEI
jgi:hypothetical protein